MKTEIEKIQVIIATEWLRLESESSEAYSLYHKHNNMRNNLRSPSREVVEQNRIDNKLLYKNFEMKLEAKNQYNPTALMILLPNSNWVVDSYGSSMVNDDIKERALEIISNK